jgi:hypothetical protein
MAVVKKVYILYTSREPSGYSFIALAEDGICLSSWMSKSETDAKSEAGCAERMGAYNNHYPEGHELVWRGGPITPYAMSSQKPGLDGSTGFIQGRLYAEFLRALTC